MERQLPPAVTARISGTGRYLPERSIDNLELFARDDVRGAFDVERARTSLRHLENAADLAPEEVFDRWVRQVTGIEARRVLDPANTGLTTEDMCAEAGKRALEAAGMTAADIDFLYVASLTCSDIVPNAACTVAALLGVPRLAGFAFNAACAGFVYGLASGWSAIASGMAESILVISGDTLTSIVDYNDLNTAVVFGDGAGAAVLTAADGERGFLGHPAMYGEFDREPLYLVGRGWETEDEPRPTLHMVGGARILRNAILTMADAADRAVRSAGLRWDDVDIVIPHQANLRITKGLEKHLDLSGGRVVHNIQRYGNMSASTVGVTLDEVLRGRHGPVPDPATFVLTAIGGGYTTAAAVVRI